MITLMLEGIGGRRKRGWQGMRWLDGMTDSMNVSLSELRSWWWTGRPAVLQFRGSQRVGDEWAAEVNWTDVAISHCSFNFQFLYDRERTSFHILICHLNDFLDKISVHIFAHVIIVFFSNCGVLRVLYVLDKSFSDICSGNIFSQLWLVLSLSKQCLSQNISHMYIFLNKVQLINFFFFGLCFWCSTWKINTKLEIPKMFICVTFYDIYRFVFCI